MPELDLAERIDRVASEARTTFDITLRAARFSDGTPVTANDVVATYRSVYEPGAKSLHHKAFAERYASVEARSDRVVRFVLHQPLATFFSDLDFGILSAHGIAEGRVIGSGPYMLRELTSSYAALEANPHYVGPAPKTPRLLIKFVRDAGARLLMLVGGSADLIQNAVRVNLVEEIRGRPRVQIDTGWSVILTFLMMNNRDPILAKPEVRQAIALAIDRQSIVATQFGGHAELASGLLPKQHWAYADNVPKWGYDPVRAGKLLDAAGYPDPDGPGPRPRMKLVYKTSSDAFRVSVARVIAGQLARVGIDVELRSFEFGTFFADVKKGSFQLASMQTTDVNEPDFYYTYFHSSRIPDATNPDVHNRMRYSNPRVDELTIAGRSELDLAKRKQIYAEVAAQVAADVPMVFLWHEDNIVLSNTDVQGYRITPNARFVGLSTAWKK